VKIKLTIKKKIKVKKIDLSDKRTIKSDPDEDKEIILKRSSSNEKEISEYEKNLQLDAIKKYTSENTRKKRPYTNKYNSILL